MAENSHGCLLDTIKPALRNSFIKISINSKLPIRKLLIKHNSKIRFVTQILIAATEVRSTLIKSSEA